VVHRDQDRDVDEVGEDGRGTQATFTLDAGVLKDTYTLAYQWDGDDRVDWHLVKGRTMKSQEGTYGAQPGRRWHRGDLPARGRPDGPDARMFKRKAEKMIMDTAFEGPEEERVESA